MDLIDTFRRQSADLHEQAEAHPLIRLLLSPDLTLEVYICYLRHLKPVYESLDQALAESPVNQLRKVKHLDLQRSKAIAADLGDLSSLKTPDLPDIDSPYAKRIKSLSCTWPLGVVAHFYTRYLGDLAGGQFIAKRVAASLGLSPDRGLRWLHFPEIGNPRHAATEVKEAINSIRASPDQADTLGEECKLAFQLNLDLFDTVWKSLDHKAKNF